MVDLLHGRTLTVERAGTDELVEIREASGQLMLRLKLTDDGVVLQLEGARISLKATESIDLQSRNLNLSADEDVRIRGKLIHLN